MLEGWETETKELNEDEHKMVGIIAQMIKEYEKSEMPVSSRMMVARLKTCGYIIHNTARIRKIINYIRRHAIVPRVVASSEGYYIARNNEDYQRFLHSLKGRADAIMEVYNAMRLQ